MEVPKIFESEYRFCLIVWEKEPVNSGKLVELARERLGWTKATTYTVIRRLCQRGVLKNEKAIVSSLVSKEEAQHSRLEEMMKEAGMWKVTVESYVEYQSTYAYRDIYLSDDGATQLLVYEGPIRFDEGRK